MLESTGICAVSGAPKPCDHAVQLLEKQITEHLSALSPISEVRQDDKPAEEFTHVTLHAGMELGLSDINDLMREKHSHLIGILGNTDAGKTLFLTALYLLFTSGAIRQHGYAFAGSRTLPGFEARARATRKWQAGSMPERMSYHTVLSDPRSSGFLHLDIYHRPSRHHSRILLSDLPGEWTTSLVNSVRHADRVGFLARADGIIVLIDATELSESSLRHIAIDRTRQLIDRIAFIGPATGARLFIVASKADRIKMQRPAAVDHLVQYAIERHGFDARGAVVASFSGDEKIESGTGVFELVRAICEPRFIKRRPAVTVEVGPSRLFGSFSQLEGSICE
ncbi:hypothetical protein [Cupriavidus sp. Agwp_2]|uniref:TRAFAC clade GTPase domain-containing protein n=1 Tax=Cupriavidus sp. Agwp_2 TaxID=2897324 RepID=UPI00345F6A65